MTRPLLGVVPRSRPGPGLARAEPLRRAAFGVLERLPADLIGPRALYLDIAGQRRAARALAEARPDRLLVLQLTFTLPAPTVRIARAVGVPLLLWGFPEPEEIILRSLAGVDVAERALREASLACACLRRHPDDPTAVDLLADWLQRGG